MLPRKVKITSFLKRKTDPYAFSESDELWELAAEYGEGYNGSLLPDPFCVQRIIYIIALVPMYPFSCFLEYSCSMLP